MCKLSKFVLKSGNVTKIVLPGVTFFTVERAKIVNIDASGNAAASTRETPEGIRRASSAEAPKLCF